MTAPAGETIVESSVVNHWIFAENLLDLHLKDFGQLRAVLDDRCVLDRTPVQLCHLVRYEGGVGGVNCALLDGVEFEVVDALPVRLLGVVGFDIRPPGFQPG